MKELERRGRKRRAGRAVVRKVGAYELSEGRESAGNVEDRMIRGEKGRRRRSVSHLSSVVAEKDSDSDGDGDGDGNGVWRLARNESFYSPGMREESEVCVFLTG